MKIVQLKLFPIQIPFKMKFKHNSAERKQTETILVQSIASNGLNGWGEGQPRKYVTAEDVRSTQTFFKKYFKELILINTLDDLKKFISAHRNSISQNPSAWCAIEMSLLDLLAKDKAQSVEDLLGLPLIEGANTYSAVLGIEDTLGLMKKTLKYRLYGFRDFKIKLSSDPQVDRRAIKLLKLSGVTNQQIRGDLNNYFSSAEDVLHYLKQLKEDLRAIEEPLQAKNFYELNKLASAINAKIILDESFTKESDLDLISKKSQRFIVNLRLSKLGGVITSLNLADKLYDKQINFSVGSHVGETSLLTRASFPLIQKYKHSIKYLEGAFSSHLLQYDPFLPNIKLKRRGLVEIQKLNLQKSGWGVTYHE